LASRRVAGSNSETEYGHLPVGQVTTNLSAVRQARVNAVSLHWQNTASDLFAAGDVTGAQLSAGTNWLSLVSLPDQFRILADAQNYLAKFGIYGFLKPTEPSDFDMVEVITDQNGAGQPLKACFDLETGHDFLGVMVSLPPTYTSQIPLSGLWLVTHGLEYHTLDQWRVTMEPDCLPEDFEHAALILSKIPQWHENPTHRANLKRMISSLATAVVKYGPAAIRTAGMVAKFLE
jgi:hypothetical protein